MAMVTFWPVPVRSAQLGLVKNWSIWLVAFRPHMVFVTGLLDFWPLIVLKAGLLDFWPLIVLKAGLCLLSAWWKTNLMSCRPAQVICIECIGISVTILCVIPFAIFVEIICFSICLIFSWCKCQWMSDFPCFLIGHEYWPATIIGGERRWLFMSNYTNMESHFDYRHRHP